MRKSIKTTILKEPRLNHMQQIENMFKWHTVGINQIW